MARDKGGAAKAPAGAGRARSGATAATPTGKAGGKAGGKSAGKAPGRGRPDRADKDPAAMGRLETLKTALRLVREQDPKVVWLLAALLVVPLAVGVVVGVLLPGWFAHITYPIAGLLVGALAAQTLLFRRAQSAAYAQIEGEKGAAAGVLDRMRGDWRVTPAVQLNRSQDMVHRVVGRSGVVLVGEGRDRSTRDLMANEVRRVRRVLGDVTVDTLMVGDGPDEVPLRRLQARFTKMPRTYKKDQVEQIDRRLKALGGTTVPIPKGPVPQRVPRSPRAR